MQTRVISDLRGRLSILDPLEFPAVRMFQIDRVPANRIRGNHAHKDCAQLIYCACGRFTVELLAASDQVRFNQHNLTVGQWIIAHPMTWIKLGNFSQNGICIVLADKPYSEPISDFNEFLRVSGFPGEFELHDSILGSATANSSDPFATGQSNSEGSGQRDLLERPTS